MEQPKPVSIRVKRVDNRTIIEVKGKYIVLSQVKPRIEKLLTASTVMEVRIFVEASLTVDANFSRHVWHGRNLVVAAEEIIVSTPVSWDMSGEDSIGTCTKAGRFEDGVGRDGMDGYPGESGGNVMVMANKIQHPKRLTIISNGGDGTCGQDGGDGEDGANGKSFTLAEFVKHFPDYMVQNGVERYRTILKIICNLMNMAMSVSIEWAKVSFWLGDTYIITSNVLQELKKFSGYFDVDIYIEAVVHDGEITFSYHGSWFTHKSFILYKGSPGQPGKPGGRYGLGGQGGFPGEITISRLNDGRTFDIATRNNGGNDGNNGKGGLYGRHGKNGWDICFWGLSHDLKYFYGKDRNSKLKLSYYNDYSPNRIFCQYKKQKSNLKFAEIEEAKIDHNLSSEFRETRNEGREEREHHSKAVGKKSIPRQRVVASFNEYLQEIEQEKQQFEKKTKEEFEKQRIETERQELEKQRIEQEKLRFTQELIGQEERQLAEQEIENIEYDAFLDVETQSTDREKLTDLNITRYINFSQDINQQRHFESVLLNASISEENDKKILDILSNNDNLNDWQQLKNRIVDLSELKALVAIFLTLESKFNTLLDKVAKDKIQDIREILKLKFKLAVLTEIAKNVPPSQKKMKNAILTAQNIARYLEETEEIDNSIFHPILGTMRQYVFENSSENRANIIQLVSSGLQYRENAINYSIKSFILELINSNTENEHVKQCYHEYLDFTDTQQSNIASIIKSLEEKLKMPKQREAFRMWNAGINDGLPEDLQKMVTKDKAFSLLYDQLKHEKNAQYDWGKCSVNQKIQEIFKTNLEREGIMNKSYRVLLAYLYDVNMRVYTRDEDNDIVLLEDHNSKSTTMTHILLEAKKFVQLKRNQAYLQLEEERLLNDTIYSNILTNIGAFQNILEIEDYLEQKLYDENNFHNETTFHEGDEEAAISKIASFYPIEEREYIYNRLKSISQQYTGQIGVFECMLERFSYEGRHVSSNELCFLINSILAHTVEGRQEKHTFSWIISAYNQCNWTDELVLLQLENCFKKPLQEKPKWRRYMANIHNKGVLLVFAAQLARNPCSEKCVEEILQLMSNVPIESVCLDQVELTEWPYVLKEYYWTSKLKSLLHWNNQSEMLTSATFFILSIENTYGDEMMKTLFETLEVKRDDLTNDVLIHVLSNFHAQKWSLCMDDINVLKQSSFKEWIGHMEEKFKINLEELNVGQLAAVIRGNGNTSNEIKQHLERIETSVENIKQNKTCFDGKITSNFLNDDINKWAEMIRNKNNDSRGHTYEEMLAVIDRAIELKRGFRLRDTQRLTVLALLSNNNKTLAQVSTGEGKSLIVVAIAIIKGLLGEKVDIVTSSSVLAKRDAVENKDIYKLFGLSVSHNCSESMEERKEAYSLNQIMYGDLANFQRDYLLDRFYGKHVLGDRFFETVIVDEVDSMLLDKGNNILYLSHDIAGMDKLESVYVFIWLMVNSPTDLALDEVVNGIKRSVLSDMYPSIEKEDIESLDKALAKSNVLRLWDILVRSGIMNDSGRLLIEDVDSKKLDETLSPEFKQYNDRLSFLIWSRIKWETCVKVPNYLKPFVEKHLDSWISSALTALYMVPGQYYVLDVDRSGTHADRHANIIILDRDTGTDQVSSQWDEALHQFLQLKHGCKLTTQNLKAVFISNVTYFKMYKLLYGLTGTLGSQRERNLLENIHQVDFVTVPTHKTKQFDEYEPIICCSKNDWMQQMRQEVDKLTTFDKRSVLIICETISEVEALRLAFRSFDQTNVHAYVRDYEKLTVVKSALEPGQVIIATNLAGRGTDIKISNELEKAGGLHVILTYLPANIRIEEQAFGRAARKGEKGSGRMIILVEDGKGPNASTIHMLKQKRNVDELYRLSAAKSYYDTTIKIEEDCFKAFNELFGNKIKCLGDAKTIDSVKDILLRGCLDKWSFWLDENSELIERSSDEASKRQVKLLLDQFIAQFKHLEATSANNWPAWVEGNPMQMIKLGKYLSQHKSKLYDTAFRLLGKVIEREPYFCEAAYYYRAYTQSLNDKNIEEFRKDLRMAQRLFEEHMKSIMHASGVISKLKTTTPQIEGYEEQKKSLMNLYSLFIQSIDDMLGHAVTPDSFVNYEIKEDLAAKIFEDLVRIGVIKKAEVICNVSDAQLHKLHSDYGISMGKLKKFLAQHIGIIDEKEFLGAIRKSFSFPNRSEFWETLVKQNVLHSVEEYVMINEERLKKIDPALMNVIQETVDKGKLIKEVIKLEKNQILLIHEQASVPYFEQKKLIDVIGETKYKSIEENGLLSVNKKATIEKSKMADCKFSAFDSMTAQDITNKTRITPREANIIIDELLQQNVLERKGDLLILADNHDLDILIPTYPVYENVIRSVLASCFAYRLALRNISLQLEEENCSEICIELKPDPHRMFFDDLLEQKIIQPPSLNESFNAEEAVEKLCDNQLLSKDSTAANYIKNVFSMSKSTLLALEEPKGNLKSIMNLFGMGNFGNTDEIRIFVTNGLEHLLQLAEKKWTTSMLLNTFIVVCAGVAQIVVGAIISIYSVGFMSHVGGAIIGEGISDIIFAINAAISGDFSWKDYGKQKLHSLVFTVSTAGVGAFLSRGVKLSAIGIKVAGPSLEYGGKRIAEISGRQLIKAVGGRTVLKATIESVTLQTVKGISFALTNTAADKMVANFLQIKLDSVASEILSGIKDEVVKHRVIQSLQKAYEMLGETDAKALVSDLTNKYMMNHMASQTFLLSVREISNIFKNGLKNASKKTGKTSSAVGFIQGFTFAVKYMDFTTQVYKILNTTRQMLDNVTIEMERMLASIEQSSMPSTEDRANETNFEHFQREIVEQWETTLSQHVGQLITRHVVLPVIKKGLKIVLVQVGKELKDIQGSKVETELARDLHRLKSDHGQKITRPDVTIETKRKLTHKYHSQLLKMMRKTRRPALFATIIRENVPMDMTCVGACTPMIQKMLQARNGSLSGLTITAHGEQGIKQSFSSGEGGPEVHLMLIDNHFTVSPVEATPIYTPENNCLYGALAMAIPEIRSVDQKAFRIMLSDYIEHDKTMHHHIEQGWHRVPLKHGVVGGVKI